MAAKKTSKMKDLPRKAVDAKKAANVRGGMTKAGYVRRPPK